MPADPSFFDHLHSIFFSLLQSTTRRQIRQAYKIALGLSRYAQLKETILALGVNNTLDELIEAHNTETGRNILQTKPKSRYEL